LEADVTRSLRLGRRAALALPLALGGCGLWDEWFGDNKTPLPGKRLDVMAASNGLAIDDKDAHIELPPPTANAGWPQAGGNPSHDMGHLQVGDALAVAWQSDIGEGGGYRAKITAQPVVAGGRIFTMDSDAVVTAYDTANGHEVWRLDTQAEHDRSANVGGGLAVDGEVLYAGTGRAEVLAIETGGGKIRWRSGVDNPVRASPTVADGRVFVPTQDDSLVALASDDGRRLWAHQAGMPETSVLGLPAPAYGDGLVVAGFESGDLIAYRAASGVVAWSDNLGAATGRNSLIDLSAIRGRPVIANGVVYAGSLGGLVVAIDLRAGRRIWERDVGTGDNPWLAGDWLFVLSTTGEVAALAREDGRVAWVSQLPRFENEEKQRDPIFWIGPALAGDRLILAGSSHEALSLSPYTGEILGRQKLPAAASVSPAIAGGTVFLTCDDGSLLALR
jgi:outer membrane protein assembly factor BamB